MKKALVILFLLSVVFVPGLARSEKEKENQHNLEARQKLTALFGDFQKSKQNLDQVTTSLVKIGDEIGSEKANKIWSIVERLLYGAVLCRTTSEMLKVAAYVDVRNLSEFFEILKPHLQQGKGQLEMQYNGLKGYSTFIEDKTALWELDKAKEVMETSLTLYDKALALLPKTK